MIAPLLAALLLAAGPCDHVADLDARLDRAAADHDAWADARDDLQLQLAPLPALSGMDEDAEVGKKVDFARARLHALCDASAAATRTFSPPDSKRLEAILARPEFDRARHRNKEVLEALLRAAWAWFQGLLESRGAGDFAEWTRALVLALAVSLAGFAAFRLLRRRAGRGRPTREAAASSEPLRLDPPRDHLRRARAALAKDPREAIREGLLALLSSLERRRLARPDRVKTNGEIAAELSTRGASAELIDRVTPLLRWYDRTFYSLAPVEAGEAGQFLDSIAALEPEAEARA